MSEGYDRDKDNVIFKCFSKNDSRYLNVEIYSYDEGDKKVRIKPVSKNTNPNADEKKKWINQKAISGLRKDEVEGLIESLKQVVDKF